jgi:hypothetical protein
VRILDGPDQIDRHRCSYNRQELVHQQESWATSARRLNYACEHWIKPDENPHGAEDVTKKREEKRDPEMHQTKKGNQWYFGMKAHVGVDSKTSRFSCMKFLGVSGVFDYARLISDSR